MDIRLEGVSKSYQGRPVLESVSLRVPSGTLMVLEGANGSGKTTLLELIAGTLEPDAGRVRIGGRAVAGLAPFDRGVFYIPQTLHKFWSLQHESRFCFIPHRTVRENLLAAAGQGRDPAEALEWMHRLGLEGCADETPERLSFGLQQRLALARALVIRPGVILVDEGLSSLDPETRVEVFDILRRTPERSRNTVVYVTHHKDDARRLGGEWFRLRTGKVVRAPSGEDRGAGSLDAALDGPRAKVLEAFTALLDYYLEHAGLGGLPRTGSRGDIQDSRDALRARIWENTTDFQTAHPGGLLEQGADSADFLLTQLRLGDAAGADRGDLARWLGVERAFLAGSPEELKQRLLKRRDAAAKASRRAAAARPPTDPDPADVDATVRAAAKSAAGKSPRERLRAMLEITRMLGGEDAGVTAPKKSAGAKRTSPK